MRIRKITLRELQMKLVTPFQISVGSTDVRRILLVEADVDGVIGWGECVAGETPMYSPETTETARHILRDFLWPLIKTRNLRPRRMSGDFWNSCAATTWPKARWKPRYGMPRPSRKTFRCGNCLAERAKKLLRAFQLELKTPSTNWWLR